ncbi:hypothetical protein [Shewanella sp. UCD-KL12]|uniref:hypothetical protein n=1 Tax=Shewanella sp. UCD-KL12 TaxID=1917163 RepID=UPI000970C83D|nr:hypothetical protein [Shewanella sp. UCD-KL12]
MYISPLKFSLNFLLPFIVIFSPISYAQTNNSQVTPIGGGVKSKFLNIVSNSKEQHRFPGLYIYNTKKQQFLSKQDAEAYLLTLDDQAVWSTLTNQWTKETSQFSTTNQDLAKTLPMLKLDREFLILYDNLPEPMLEQFKAMDPELKLKDATLKSVLSSLENSRSYTTY